MVYESTRNLKANARNNPGLVNALRPLLLPLLLALTLPLVAACPAQVAWEEGQRNHCKQTKQLARRCWSYGILSNLQCQTEEEEEKERESRGDFTPVDTNPVRLTTLSCDRELLATYLYCDGLIPEGCRTPETSSSSSGSSSGSSSSSSARRADDGGRSGSN